MKITQKSSTIFLVIILILINEITFADEEIECALSSSVSMATPPSNVTAMIVYAQDSDDNYPFPSSTLRDEIEGRLSDLYYTISYHAHTITFKETTDGGDYYISDYSASYYKSNYNTSLHDGPYGMFNEEILDKVVADKGASWFTGVDMIIMVGTDGGSAWYTPSANATGYGRLGVDYTVGSKTFGKGTGEGGITIEIGSDGFSPDSLYNEEEIYWVMAHEYGHWLKLLHPEQFSSTFVGVYSLMHKELHRNDRMPTYGPAPIDPFQLIELGWIDQSDGTRVKSINNTTNVTINQLRKTTGLIMVRIDVPSSPEKFYVTYHQQSNNDFDGVYKSSGLLIWHRASSSSIDYDVECGIATGPNGRDHFNDGTDTGGLVTDFFSESNNYQFTPWTNPNSEDAVYYSWSHDTTGIAITNIDESGDQVTFDVKYDFSSGEITKDSWWNDDALEITDNITVESGVKLTVEDNTTVNVAPGAAIIVEGELDADGSSGPITFTRSGGSGNWDYIKFESGSTGEIKDANIEYATKGIYSLSDNVTIEGCTIEDFTEQAIYAIDSDIEVIDCTIQNPDGASHGIYLDGTGNPAISYCEISDISGIGIYREDGNGTFFENTIANCTTGLQTYNASPEIYNNYFDGEENSDNGIRIQTSSSPDIHDNDFFDCTIGIWLEQSEPGDLKWNNFGYTSSATHANEDVGLYINYLTSSNDFADYNWNNFYDGNEVVDVDNNGAYTLLARGNYWDSQSIEGSVNATSPQGSHNSNAGPDGSVGKTSEHYVRDRQMAATLPENFGLEQNFPNPFNPSTVISFHLPQESKVDIVIYDVLGRSVRSLTGNTFYQTGTHEITWNGKDDSGNSLASGVYFYHIKAAPINGADIFNETRKLVFVQ